MDDFKPNDISVLDFEALSEEREAEFKQLFYQYEAFIENTYGVMVHEAILKEPVTGEFYGDCLLVSELIPAETQLWILIHIFGHNTQWLAEFTTVNVGKLQPRFEEFDSFREESIAILKEIEEYEREACQLGLYALQQAGITHLDQWVSNWFSADFEYLKDAYFNGYNAEKAADVKGFYYKEGCDLIVPKEVPSFTIKKIDGKYAF